MTKLDLATLKMVAGGNKNSSCNSSCAPACQPKKCDNSNSSGCS